LKWEECFTLIKKKSFSDDVDVFAADEAGSSTNDTIGFLFYFDGIGEVNWPVLQCPGQHCYWLLMSHAIRSMAAIYFLLEAAREARFIGRKMFIENMVISKT
jgi:hypothetical protein